VRIITILACLATGVVYAVLFTLAVAEALPQ